MPASLRSALAVATVLVLGGCRTALRPPVLLHETDLDGDGRVDRFETLRPGGGVERTTLAPIPGSRPARTVVLAIDAIPHEVFAELQAEGLFREFFPPARLVAPFPSLTDVGFTAILRTPPSAAYEDRYFDRATNETGGGMWARVTNRYKDLAPFHAAFDWEEPHLWGAFVFFLPGRISSAELRRMEQQLHRRQDDEMVLYVGSTDALGHKLGRPALAAHLRKVDRLLKGFFAAGGADRRVVLFSDHGMSRVASRRFDLEGAVEAAGFRLRSGIEGPQDVVSPAYGLVGSVQLYTACGQEEAVARALVAGEGADFAVWRQDDGSVGAVDARGSADPLERDPAEYPMLRERVEAGIRNHTLHPASVILSLEDGWHYGSGFFDWMVRIVGTHGSARYDSSVGFLASNVERPPEWLLAEDAWPYLGLAREPEPPRELIDPCRGDGEAAAPAAHAPP